jgi:hypothetical protein
MIKASLSLILVAVTLLVLGLTGGSSGLLIGSIVASLLAAVALVIGARKAAKPDFAPDDQETFPGAAEASGTSGAVAPAVFDDRPTVVNGPLDDLDPATRWHDTQPADDDTHGAPDDDTYAAPDYERAASVINAARTENPDEHAWRRTAEPAADPEPTPASFTDASFTDASPVASPGPDLDPDLDLDLAPSPASAPFSSSAGEFDFAEAEADDPDDEPLPQAVRPTDAVRIARLDAEVLVVDGRPRYHLADCAHLVGRLTEPIPVNEAVELGFSPCGLCRPVDRLVAAAVRT